MTQPKPAGSSGSDPGRSDRPLGRGLEDISPVFLSPPTETGNPDPRSPWAARARPHEAATQSPFLLRPALQVTREQVGAALGEFLAALEEGLKAVDAGIPCPPCGEIDLLAIDRAGRLAVIDFEITAGDELLVRGLGQVDWVARNVANLRRMLRGQAINFSLPPRLFLLAPQFSPRVRCAARLMPGLQIDWVVYRLVEATGRAGIFFEAAATD